MAGEPYRQPSPKSEDTPSEDDVHLKDALAALEHAEYTISKLDHAPEELWDAVQEVVLRIGTVHASDDQNAPAVLRYVADAIEAIRHLAAEDFEDQEEPEE